MRPTPWILAVALVGGPALAPLPLAAQAEPTESEERRDEEVETEREADDEAERGAEELEDEELERLNRQLEDEEEPED